MSSSSLPPIDCSSPSLTSPDYKNLTASIVILVGILLSYLPQHHRIISRKSSEGISAFFLLLGVTSGTCGLMNIWILGSGVVACCQGLGPFRCFAGVLGILQVSMQWAMFMIILILFLIYFPAASPALPTTEDEDPAPARKHIISTTHPSIAFARTITILSAVHFLVVLIVSISLYLGNSTHLLAWANALGIQSTILASLQYLPQIYTTWRLQHVGSLSIPMMCIQTPGSFIWALSLAMRDGTAWSSWLVYVVSGTLQGVLLVMCVGFEIRERRRMKAEEADVRGRMNESLETDRLLE